MVSSVGRWEEGVLFLPLSRPLSISCFFSFFSRRVRCVSSSGLFTRSLRSSPRSLVRSPSCLVLALALLLCVRVFECECVAPCQRSAALSRCAARSRLPALAAFGRPLFLLAGSFVWWTLGRDAVNPRCTLRLSLLLSSPLVPFHLLLLLLGMVWE